MTDVETASRIEALRAIAAGETLDWLILQDLVGAGLVHATTTRLVMTEKGNALLQESE